MLRSRAAVILLLVMTQAHAAAKEWNGWTGTEDEGRGRLISTSNDGGQTLSQACLADLDCTWTVRGANLPCNGDGLVSALVTSALPDESLADVIAYHCLDEAEQTLMSFRGLDLDRHAAVDGQIRIVVRGTALKFQGSGKPDAVKWVQAKGLSKAQLRAAKQGNAEVYSTGEWQLSVRRVPGKNVTMDSFIATTSIDDVGVALALFGSRWGIATQDAQCAGTRRNIGAVNIATNAGVEFEVSCQTAASGAIWLASADKTQAIRALFSTGEHVAVAVPQPGGELDWATFNTNGAAEVLSFFDE